MSLTDALHRILRPEHTVYARVLVDANETAQTTTRELQTSAR